MKTNVFISILAILFFAACSNADKVAIDNSNIDFFDFKAFFEKEIKDFSFKKNYLVKKNKNNERNNENLCLMMIDVDDFKAINDKFGHVKGDEILSKIGQLHQARKVLKQVKFMHLRKL